MTPELRNEILQARTRTYTTVMATLFAIFLTVVAILAFGIAVPVLPLAAIVVAAAAYGVIAGGAAMDDMLNLRSDMEHLVAETQYGCGVSARCLPTHKLATNFMIVFVAFAELCAILT